MDTLKPIQDDISRALVSTTRSTTRLSSADVKFQRSLDPEAEVQLDAQNARLLHLAQRLLQNAAASSEAVGPKLPDVEAIDANWRGVVDVIDSLLERADTSLDEYTGIVKRIVPGERQSLIKPLASIAEKKILPKPQLEFEHVPNNHETGGFHPLLSSKPHAITPLEECLKTFKDKRGREQYPHPYQTEIESYDYPPAVYQASEPQAYQPLEYTTATFVDTPDALAMMLTELKTAKEIAIDVEHHDNRSYIGLVSLMQISTRDKDWIVDTLKPWRRKLECLNEVFANPNILKVLHGAHMDIIWLQRDLGLYVVGLFDTYHAARSLGYPGASLAYLLLRFANFNAQKQYQLADWRLRPLTQELIEYAQADTHFLLYIYDNMRNELVDKSDLSNLDKNKVRDVLQKSKETALQRYEHPVYDTELGLGLVGWYKLISRTPVQFSSQQFSVFKAVHQWRDKLGREQDDSPLFVMSNHAVFSVARAMPSNKASLFTAIQHVSHIVKDKADQLIDVVSQAKDDDKQGCEIHDVLTKVEAMKEAEWLNAQSSTSTMVVPVVTPLSVVQIQSDPVTTAVRAPTSQFWGEVWSNGVAESKQSIPDMKIDLAIPLPPLTAEIFHNATGTTNSQMVDIPKLSFVPKEDRPTEDERTDTFIIKQLGSLKRKRGASPQEATSSAPALDPMTKDEIMLDSEDKDSSQAIRAREKSARKAARKQKKREQAAVDLDEPAFDYASAPSVLHGNDEEDMKKRCKDNKKKNGVFDPFKNMINGPKGLPLVKKEMPGKSKTFQS